MEHRIEAPPPTAAILANVAWIIDQLDRRGLAEIDDIPVLELAKHISVDRKATS